MEDTVWVLQWGYDYEDNYNIVLFKTKPTASKILSELKRDTGDFYKLQDGEKLDRLIKVGLVRDWLCDEAVLYEEQVY